MAAQNGKDLLIKLDINGDQTFETIAGLRASRITFNAETVDVTSLEKRGAVARIAGGRGGALGCDFRLWRVQGCGHG